MMNGTIIGTNNDKVTPVINETTAVFPSVALEMIGRVVSIAVAPAGAILSNFPIYLAIRGMVIIAMISLETFVIKARVPSCALCFASSMADKLYHPNPAPMAPAC